MSSPSLVVVPCPPFHKNLASERSEDGTNTGEEGGYGDHKAAEEKSKGNGFWVFFASLAILGVTITGFHVNHKVWEMNMGSVQSWGVEGMSWQ